MVVETFLAFLSKIFCFTSFVAGKNSFPQPLSASEEKRCVELVKEGDLAAREKLIRHNLRLVAHVVKKYHSAGEADDLKHRTNKRHRDFRVREREPACDVLRKVYR